MVAGPSPQATVIHPHHGIEDDLDRTYVATIHAAAASRVYLRHPRGPVTSTFFQFYGAFSMLVEHTHQMTNMNLDYEFEKRLLAWIDDYNLPQKKMAAALAEGLMLFREYQKILIDKGLVYIQRR